LQPEQPPPTTATRKTPLGRPCFCRRELTFWAAAGQTLISRSSPTRKLAGEAALEADCLPAIMPQHILHRAKSQRQANFRFFMLAPPDCFWPHFLLCKMKRQYFCIPRRVALATISLGLMGLFCAARVSAADNNTNSSGKTAPAAPPLEVADGLLLAIPKAGLGKDYQFTASIIPQELAATSTGLAGKIVRFELFPDGVDMYESTQGLVVTEDLPARRLLATFPIVRQDDKGWWWISTKACAGFSPRRGRAKAA
jgi:hypothetical protein